MNDFELLEHTADMGIAAVAETRAELFRQMALGLRKIITGCADIRADTSVELEVTGKDDEELLVNWLGELVFLLETRHLLPAEFVVDSLGQGRLKARVRGERFDPVRHYIDREIKAVTYHQIRIEELSEGWTAQVFVDL